MANFDRIYLYSIFFIITIYYIYKNSQVFFHFIFKNTKYKFFYKNSVIVIFTTI